MYSNLNDFVFMDISGEMTVVAQSPYRYLWPRFEMDGKTLVYFSRRDTDGKDDEIYR